MNLTSSLVRDDGAGFDAHAGQGLGLANIQERLRLLYGEQAALSVQAGAHGGVEAALTVPLAAGA